MSADLAKLIDLALLHPTLTDKELHAGCEKAKQLSVASVCIKPYAVKLAADRLRGSGVAVGTVIGFPHGSNAPEIKAAEAKLACEHGATELDMVVNIGKVMSEDWDFVERDVKAVLDVARQHKAVLKVIFENDYLTKDEWKIKLCEICGKLGVDYVKTSTGFGFVKQASGDYNYKGATEKDVALMRKHSPKQVGIKAAGGVRTQAEALKMQELGCTRLGTSAPEPIIGGGKSTGAGY
ncbi:MAG TPA: deoxyribose-phosphate aldolase [Pirellulales bacterium]|jgi:deoxyribose-phosphate aldolase|nr:deoxyribose-phosphate aldolase [Pirellulales bacterium]